MALIDCPECGKEVSNKAASCPNCGVGISTLLEDSPSKGLPPSKQNTKEALGCVLIWFWWPVMLLKKLCGVEDAKDILGSGFSLSAFFRLWIVVSVCWVSYWGFELRKENSRNQSSIQELEMAYTHTIENPSPLGFNSDDFSFIPKEGGEVREMQPPGSRRGLITPDKIRKRIRELEEGFRRTLWDILQIMILPPLGLLLLAYGIAWIVKGFIKEKRIKKGLFRLWIVVSVCWVVVFWMILMTSHNLHLIEVLSYLLLPPVLLLISAQVIFWILKGFKKSEVGHD